MDPSSRLSGFLMADSRTKQRGMKSGRDVEDEGVRTARLDL